MITIRRAERHDVAAIAEAEARGCGLVQLTSDLQRPDAHRSYEQLGFVASHVGFKLAVEGPTGVAAT